MKLTSTRIQGNLLFWKIAATFTAVLIVLSLVFAVSVPQFSRSYYMAAHQELYGDIAQHLASFTQPLKNGQPDTTVTHDIIHSTMVANPSVEVYLLDTAGNITDYVVPDTTVQIHRVDIAKVKQWLAVQHGEKPLGDNPKQPGEPGIFSAAPLYYNGAPAGYVYAVLASEKQKEILNGLNHHLNTKLLLYMLAASLTVALMVGIATYLLITKSVRNIAGVVRRFKEGDYSARIEGNAQGDIGLLSTTFNDMADVIVDNFDQVTATDKFRQELIANVSHDLRTPLSIMRGYIETLMMKKNELPPEELNRYLSVVHNSTKKLTTLVEQLFQFASLEANLVVPEKENFLLTELASDILMAYQLKAAERNIQLRLDAAPDLASVFADIRLTERVLQNLLDNAFKFTPDGGSIVIRLSAATSGIKVQVADTGIGIAPEDQAWVFERYKQSGKSTEQKGGMGIGLAIVKKILDLHQATIDVISEPGKGTSFRFVLSSV